MKYKVLLAVVSVIAVAGIVGTLIFKSQDDNNLKLLATSNESLASTKTELATKESDLVQMQTNLDTINAQLSTTKDTLTSTQTTLANTQATLTNTQDQLTSANNQLTTDTSELASDTSQLASDTSQIASDKTKLDFYNQAYQYQLKFGMQPPYQMPSVVNGNWSTVNMDLVSNPNANEPTFAQLKAFLLADKNIDQPYTDSQVVCSNYAQTVYNDCEAAGIKTYLVVLWFSDITEGHALNAFLTTDKGLVFADCTSGDVYSDSTIGYAPFVRVGYITVGKEYQTLSFSAVDSSADAGSYQYIVNYGKTHLTYDQIIGTELDVVQGIEGEINGWNNNPAITSYNSELANYNNEVTQYNSQVSTANLSDPSILLYYQNWYSRLQAESTKLTAEFNQLEAQYNQLIADYHSAEASLTYFNNSLTTNGVYTFDAGQELVKAVEIYEP